MLNKQINKRNVKHIVIAAMTSISAKPSNRALYIAIGVICFKALLRDLTLFYLS